MSLVGSSELSPSHAPVHIVRAIHSGRLGPEEGRLLHELCLSMHCFLCLECPISLHSWLPLILPDSIQMRPLFSSFLCPCCFTYSMPMSFSSGGSAMIFPWGINCSYSQITGLGWNWFHPSKQGWGYKPANHSHYWSWNEHQTQAGPMNINTETRITGRDSLFVPKLLWWCGESLKCVAIFARRGDPGLRT